MPKVNPLIVRYYNNNPKLKAAGVKIKYTQEMIEERIKCTQDPTYFVEKYVKIIHVDKGLVDFKMYDFQKKIMQSFIDNRFTIVKCSRQIGKSTITNGFLLWQILFAPTQNIAILANKGSTAKDILAKLAISYENVPLWMQQGIVSWNKHSIELENGSKIIAASTSSSATRGNTYNTIFLDEFAFVPHNVAENFIRSVIPTMSSGETTKIIMVSTPNGMNHFYKYWTDAVQGKNPYVPIEAHWSQIPGRDDKWVQEQIQLLGSQEAFEQEYNADFLGSSNTLIKSAKLSTIPFRKPINKHPHLSIYQNPVPKHEYVICVDSARGQGKDNSAFVVIDVTESPYRLVAKYMNSDISPMLYPSVIANAAKAYNNAYLLIESNDIGHEVANSVHLDFEHENIFWTVNMGRGGQKIIHGSSSKSAKLGVVTTHQLKKVGCAHLKTLIENDQLIVEDVDIISELSTFVSTQHSYAAEPGRHDDLVICLVLFAWLTTQEAFKEITDSDIRKKLQEQKLKDEEDQMAPFGAISTGLEEEHIVDREGNIWQPVHSYELNDLARNSRYWSDVSYTPGYDEDDFY